MIIFSYYFYIHRYRRTQWQVIEIVLNLQENYQNIIYMKQNNKYLLKLSLTNNTRKRYVKRGAKDIKK